MIGFDREKLTEQILQDGSLPAYGYVPPAITPGPGNQTFREANGDLVPKDVSSARQLWEKGIEEVGEEPKLTMLFGDDSLQRDMATYMQDQYKENLGADFDVEVVTFNTALDRVDAEDYEINYAFGVDRRLRRPDDLHGPLSLGFAVQQLLLRRTTSTTDS